MSRILRHFAQLSSVSYHAVKQALRKAAQLQPAAMLQRLVRRSAGAPVALARAALSGAAAPCACASVQELVPAAPGTVTPYSHHVFIRCAPPEDLAPPETSGREGLAWWPAVVEKCVLSAQNNDSRMVLSCDVFFTRHSHAGCRCLCVRS